MTRFLVDNSVLQRLPRNAAVQAAMAAILAADHELCCCAPSLDEFAYSTRSPADHAEATERLRTSFLYLPLSSDVDQLVIAIRSSLWAAGIGRAAGVIDVMLAAIAVDAHATVLHYDADFDHIAEAFPSFSASMDCGSRVDRLISTKSRTCISGLKVPPHGPRISEQLDGGVGWRVLSNGRE